jgi:hypothetical protein
MKLIGKLIKGTIDIVLLPLEISKDVITLGGVLTDKDSYTADRLKKAGNNFSQFYNNLDK